MDGAVVENVNISDIKMKDVQTPIFIVLGKRGRKQPGEVGEAPTGKIRHVVIRNVTAVSHSKMSSSITAFPGAYIEGVVLQHISISGMGGGTRSEANLLLKEAPAAYPENRMYGEVYPASGLFIRHVNGITLESISLHVRNSDSRPTIILDDVTNAKLESVTTENCFPIKNSSFTSHFGRKNTTYWEDGNVSVYTSPGLPGYSSPGPSNSKTFRNASVGRNCKVLSDSSYGNVVN